MISDEFSRNKLRLRFFLGPSSEALGREESKQRRVDGDGGGGVQPHLTLDKNSYEAWT